MFLSVSAELRKCCKYRALHTQDLVTFDSDNGDLIILLITMMGMMGMGCDEMGLDGMGMGMGMVLLEII